MIIKKKLQFMRRCFILLRIIRLRLRLTAWAGRHGGRIGVTVPPHAAAPLGEASCRGRHTQGAGGNARKVQGLPHARCGDRCTQGASAPTRSLLHRPLRPIGAGHPRDGFHEQGCGRSTVRTGCRRKRIPGWPLHGETHPRSVRFGPMEPSPACKDALLRRLSVPFPQARRRQVSSQIPQTFCPINSFLLLCKNFQAQ